MLASVAALSCGPKGGTDVGNGATTVKVNLRGYQRPSTTQSITLASGTEVDAFFIAVDNFRLQPGSGCAGSNGPDEVGFEGPAIADLLGSGVLGERPAMESTAGPHCRLWIGLHPTLPDEVLAGVPSELGGFAVLVRGQRADGVPFTARTRLKFDVKLEATAGSFDVESSEDHFVVGFDLEAIVATLELEAFPGPTIDIDDTTAPSVVAKLDRALRTSAKLFHDDDADGALAPAEAEAGDELAADAGN